MVGNGFIFSEQGENVPNFAELRELSDLGDGVSLVGLLTFYCPDFIDWTQMALNEPFSMADCLYNLEMVRNFCYTTLPYNVCHLSLEDFVYMHRYGAGFFIGLSIVVTIVINFLAQLRPAKYLGVFGRPFLRP